MAASATLCLSSGGTPRRKYGCFSLFDKLTLVHE